MWRSDEWSISENDKCQQHQFQIILTPDQIVIQVGKVKESLFNRVVEANRTGWGKFYEAVIQGVEKLHGINIADCCLIDKILYMKGLLWVPDNDNLHTDVLREIHNQSASGHPSATRMLSMLKCHYYWPGCSQDIRQYVCNCHPCHQSKPPQNKPNGLLVPLPIPEQCWKDITMDFITGLLMSEGHNAICTIIDQLTKEWHYVPCHWGESGMSAEATAWILIWNIFQLHSLPASIMSDWGTQFTSLVWKAFCKKL